GGNVVGQLVEAGAAAEGGEGADGEGREQFAHGNLRGSVVAVKADAGRRRGAAIVVVSANPRSAAPAGTPVVWSVVNGYRFRSIRCDGTMLPIAVNMLS